MASQCGGRLSPDRFCKIPPAGAQGRIHSGRTVQPGRRVPEGVESLLRGGRRGLHRMDDRGFHDEYPAAVLGFSGDKGSPVCTHCPNPCGYGAADAGAGGRILRPHRLYGSADRRISGNPGRAGIRGGNLLVQGAGMDSLWVCPEFPLYGKYGPTWRRQSAQPTISRPMRLSPITFRSAISASLRFRTRGMPPQACARPAGF